MQAFYINLDRDTERRRRVEGELVRAELDSERVAGIDGGALPSEFATYFFEYGRPVSTLTPGEIGCYASHLKVMRIIVECSVEAALVLEDDAKLDSGIVTTLNSLLQVLPKGWDVVLMCRAPKRACVPLATLSNEHALVRYSRIPVGATGYLISQSGATKLLQDRKRRRPIDADMGHPWLFNLDVYGVVPPPIAHDKGLISTIGPARGHARLIRALPDPRRFLFNVRKLGRWWWLRCALENIVLRKVRPRPVLQNPWRG